MKIHILSHDIQKLGSVFGLQIKVTSKSIVEAEGMVIEENK